MITALIISISSNYFTYIIILFFIQLKFVNLFLLLLRNFIFRGPRMSQPPPPAPAPGPGPGPGPGPVPRQRLKRPMPPQQGPVQQQSPASASKQRRMDVLMPDRNEDADCHVIAQQKRNDGLPVIQNVQGGAAVQSNRSDSTIHLTDSITLSVRQPGMFELFTYLFVE